MSDNHVDEKRIALTIAGLAVAQSIVAAEGDGEGNDALLAATQAANAWAYFQAKSTKQTMFEIQLHSSTTDESLSFFKSKIEKYEKEKEEIKIKAEDFEKQVNEAKEREAKLGFSDLALQLSIVLASVAIVARWNLLWFFSVGIGVFALFKLCF